MNSTITDAGGVAPWALGSPQPAIASTPQLMATDPIDGKKGIGEECASAFECVYLSTWQEKIWFGKNCHKLT
ncbi:MAG: hypothetical protein AAF892_02385 [Cyanobacteria bacterium P01_D01_bin.71]